MPKVKAPLYSFFASGTLNDILTFYTRQGNSFVRQKQNDPISKTALQEDLRTLFKDASVLAKGLSDNQKSYYASLNPNSAACPWWNNYIGEYIKEHWIGVGLSVKSLQCGTIDLLNHTDHYHDITGVDVDKSILVYTGNFSTAANLRSSFCYMYLYSNTQIRCRRGGNSPGLVVGYMVMELKGLLRDVEHVYIGCYEVAENYADIPSFNINKSILLYCGVDSNLNEYKTLCGRFWIESSTRIRLKFGSSSGSKHGMCCLLELP